MKDKIQQEETEIPEIPEKCITDPLFPPFSPVQIP